MTKYHSTRWWDFPSALLLMAAMLTSASRLVVTNWTVHLSIVQTVAFFGLISGLALGYSRFSRQAVVIFASVYGMFLISWQIGMTLSDKLSWMERMIVLINRLRTIFLALYSREPVRDSLLFLIVMFCLFWLISVHAGYALTRHGDPWLAIIPGGLALFIIHTFDPVVEERIWYLAAYLFFGLVLVSRMTFIHRQADWQHSRTALPSNVSLDFIRYTILSAFLIVLFAWTVPALARAIPQANQAWQPVREAWYNTVNQFENAFVSLRGAVTTFTTVYSQTASLGQGTNLTEAQIFRAEVPVTIPAQARIYWRARVYDAYHNGQWVATSNSSQDFDPQKDELPVEQWIGRWQGQFKIISAANILTLFTPEQPLWVSHPGQVFYTSNPDGTIDINMFTADPGLGAGESYQVLSALSYPSAQLLRQAGTDYPVWITRRYLKIPDSITERTRQLAVQITAGLTNPYDKAEAISDYLRRNIQYTPMLEKTPPSNQEPIDWFLFDAKQGFCNYYASAQVIMLRSLGIPARWVIGYAQGEQINTDSADKITYLIREKDAHAWPEVYFPHIGWVEFEPTTSQPVLERPIEAEESSTEAPGLEEELAALREDKRVQLELLRGETGETYAPSTTARLRPWLIGIAWAACLLTLAAITLLLLPLFGLPTAPNLLQNLLRRAGIEPPERLKRLAEQNPGLKPIQLRSLPVIIEVLLNRLGLRSPVFLSRWARYSELPILSKSYLEINQGLKRLGQPAAVTDTPAERARALGKTLPPLEAPAMELVHQYQIGTFSNQLVDLELAQRSAAVIRRLSSKAFLQRLLRQLQEPDLRRNPLQKKRGKRRQKDQSIE